MEGTQPRLSMRRPAWADIRAEAIAHHGVVTSDHALRAGLSRSSLSRAVGRGELVRLAPRVLGLPDLLDDWSHVAAVCAATPSAVASHRAAARLHGMDGIDQDVVEVSVTGAGRPRRRHVHRSSDLVRGDITAVTGIPTTNVTRTLCDLGAVCPVEVLEQAVESALRLRTTTFDRLMRRCVELSRAGRAGPNRLRAVLDRRGPSAPPTESALETLALQCFRAGGVPEPVRQHIVRVDGTFIARVDLAWPGARVYVELDGRAHHASWDAQRRDAERQNRLSAAGWAPLRYTWADITQDGPGVAARTVATLAVRSPAQHRGAA